MESKCKNSATGKHVWSEPRFEDSVDKNRGNETKQYCTLCYKTKSEESNERIDSDEEGVHLLNVPRNRNDF